MNDKVLIVDDEDLVRKSIVMHLNEYGFETEQADSGKAALDLLRNNRYSLILTDLKMPGLSGMELLDRIRATHTRTEVIFMTGYGTIDTAVEAIRRGAYDFLTKPLDFDRLLIVVRNALEKASLHNQIDTLKTQVQKELDLNNIVGSNLTMLKVFDTIRRVGDSDVNVLITGESGTGKELIARALHRNSNRSSGPFVPVNCVALADNLLESELFGHEKGAFTGAAGRKIGYFEAAEGGTIFLDEIGDLPRPLQAKLLRTLQERTIQRVGNPQVIPVDVRVISATNKQLDQMIHTGEFREDLYYRLNVLSLELPPLRLRKDDLPQLADFFLKKISGRMSRPPATLTQDAEQILMAYDWPGNVRELENIIQRAVALCENGQITADNLPPHLVSSAKSGYQIKPFDAVSSFKEAKNNMIDAFEKEFLQEALKRNRGNVTKASDEIGIGRTVMQRLLKKHGIESRDYKKAADGDAPTV